MNPFIRGAQSKFNDWPEASLRIAIIVVALLAIVLALSVENKWVLAGILAYLALP